MKIGNYILRSPLARHEPPPTPEQVAHAEDEFVAAFLVKNQGRFREMLAALLMHGPAYEANILGLHCAVTKTAFLDEPVLLIPHEYGTSEDEPGNAHWRAFSSWCNRRFGRVPEEAWHERERPRVVVPK